MIARFFRYSRKVFHFQQILQKISDGRPRPQIKGKTVFIAIFLLFLLRLGSLNGLEEFLRDPRRQKKWGRFLEGNVPSADAIAYYADRVDCDSLREALHDIYTRLQRNHQINPLRIGGWLPLAIDGHELFASYNRHCDQCRQRKIKTTKGERTQYYHSIVAAHLIGGPIPILLDAEEQRPGEDEIAAALRLLERVQSRYPKAYDVVTADALYADPRIVSFLLKHNKHILAVLKNNQSALLADAKGLCNRVNSTHRVEGKNEYIRWDIEKISSWNSVNALVRVIRSRETKPFEGQLVTSDWYWVTTFSQSEASTETVCQIGHGRWDIENDAYNYLHTYYHLDHAFRHHSNAIMVFVLFAFIAYILVSAFHVLNLKPAARKFCCLTTLTRRFMLTIDSLLSLCSNGKNPIRGPT